MNECDLKLAEAKLLSAGCVRAPWSWGSCDPARLQALGDNVKSIHEKSIPEYEDIDNNSVRFAFPPESVHIMNEPITLILPSFVGVGPPRAAALERKELAQEETQDDDGNSAQFDKGLETEPSAQKEDTAQDTVQEEIQNKERNSAQFEKAPEAETNVLVQEEDMLQDANQGSAQKDDEKSVQPEKTSEAGNNPLTQEQDELQDTYQGAAQDDYGKLPEREKTPEAETGALVQEKDAFQEPALPSEPQLLAEMEPYPESENVQPVKSLQVSNPQRHAENTLDMKEPQSRERFPENTADDSKLICVDGFLYYPRLPVLLESLIRVRLRVPEDKVSIWASMLHVWAITYLWAQTMASEDVLDGIEDNEVKTWFNNATKRFDGGIDRVTVTKRKGRVKSTRPPVDLDNLFQD